MQRRSGEAGGCSWGMVLRARLSPSGQPGSNVDLLTYSLAPPRPQRDPGRFPRLRHPHPSPWSQPRQWLAAAGSLLGPADRVSAFCPWEEAACPSRPPPRSFSVPAAVRALRVVMSGRCLQIVINLQGRGSGK